MAAFLQAQGLAADHFHAGLKPEKKKEVQEQFQRGELRVIAATNAFGMGIDKPDIRLVIHADIPGSLENYVQEAGRAGRDRKPARCVLLFCSDDIERQFKLSAHSRLSKREIAAILRALRRLDARTKRSGEVIATPGEIIKEELDREFERDTATDDTRVKTAVAWLEEAALASREENRVRVFPSCLKIRTLDEAKAILDRADITQGYRFDLLKLIEHLIQASPDAGISTDDLGGASGLTGNRLRKALADLEHLGIASNDTKITVFLHLAVANASKARLAAACALETALIDRLRELAPDMDVNDRSLLNLKLAAQELRDLGHASVRPHIVERLLKGLSQDGRDDEDGRGSLAVRKRDRETVWVTLQRSWEALARTAELRRAAAQPAAVHAGELRCSGRAGQRHPGRDYLRRAERGARRRSGNPPARPGRHKAARPRPALAARAGGGDLGKGPHHLPSGDDGEARARRAAVHPVGLRAAADALRRADAADPHHGGVRQAGACLDRCGAVARGRLLHPRARELHRPVAGRPERRAASPDEPRVLARHRREPPQPGPGQDRGR